MRGKVSSNTQLSISSEMRGGEVIGFGKSSVITAEIITKQSLQSASYHTHKPSLFAIDLIYILKFIPNV